MKIRHRVNELERVEWKNVKHRGNSLGLQESLLCDVGPNSREARHQRCNLRSYDRQY